MHIKKGRSSPDNTVQIVDREDGCFERAVIEAIYGQVEDERFAPSNVLTSLPSEMPSANGESGHNVWRKTSE